MMASPSVSELENTLPDGAWKDSFDKLLDIKPKLRELNLLKQNVRASFNNDSSVENSQTIPATLRIPEVVPNVSTPVRNLSRQPFRCSISPIPQWALEYFTYNKQKREALLRKRVLTSTATHPELVVTDFDDGESTTTEAPQPQLPQPIAPKDTTMDEVFRNSSRLACFLPKPDNKNLRSKDITLSQHFKRLKSIRKTIGLRLVAFDNNLRTDSIPNSVVLQKSQRESKGKNSKGRTAAEINSFEQRKKQSEPTTASSKQSVIKKRSSPTKNKRQSSADMTAFDDGKSKTTEPPHPIAPKDTTMDELLQNAPRRACLLPNPDNDNRKSKDITITQLIRTRKSARKTLRQVAFDNNVRTDSIPNSVVLQKSQRQSKGKISKGQTGVEINSFEQRKKQSEPKTASTKQRVSKKRSSPTKNKRKSSADMTALHPGKWRKSLSCLRRSQIIQAQVRRSSNRKVGQLEDILDCDESVEFVAAFPATKLIGQRKTILVKQEENTTDNDILKPLENHKDRVLQYCNQNEPVPFAQVYDVKKISDCFKIGEGVYGEVFVNRVNGEEVVCKIIPIEGPTRINDEVQKTYEQILPEIVISKELSNLKNQDAENSTSGFVEIKKVACIQGKYPDHLIKHWEAFDNEKGSENDHPGHFPETQLYVVLELEFAGKDLESFVFNNAEQSYFALKQIVLTLAVAEESLEFEHRDLHWGNVLIRPTNDSEFKYKLHGDIIMLPSMGIKTTIIDYTLSRMKYKDHCFYNDLSNDEELFTATGDYQFDMYRMMRDILGNNWERFEPKTNVFWISYITTKLVNGVKYSNVHSKSHTQYLRKMRKLRKDVLEYNSACAIFKYL